MKKYIVTGFNEEYYKWGAAWFASLKEIANFEHEAIVVGYNLSVATQNKLISSGVHVLQGNYTGDYRTDNLLAISKVAKSTDAIFAYWDADVQFQSDISEVFNLAKSNFASTPQGGFLAGPSYQFALLEGIMNSIKFLKTTTDLHFVLLKHFSDLVDLVDNTWNYTDVYKLKNKEGSLCVKGDPVKVVHTSGQSKTLIQRDILFWERHSELYSRYIDTKKSSKRKLVLQKKVVE